MIRGVPVELQYMFMVLWSSGPLSLITALMQTDIVIVSGSILNVSTVHLNGIWHLIWRYLSKPVLGGHPVLSRHFTIPRGCPLNTGFIVFLESNFISKQELSTRTSFVYKTLQLVRISLSITTLNKEFCFFLRKVIL